MLLGNLDAPAQADPRPIRFTTGHRKQAWSHNCLALGLAAGFMEPLESTSLHLVQTAIARFIKFIPSSPAETQGRDIFNRQTMTEWLQIRDFLVLHYAANGREDEPFWDEVRSMSLPDTLMEKIRLFEESGTIVKEEGELFTEEGWTQVMVGQGIQPRAHSPMTNGIDPRELGDFLSSLANAYRQRAEALPTHEEWLNQMLNPQMQPASVQ